MENDQAKAVPLHAEAVVGRRVRYLRESAGLSQRELGERLGEYGYAMVQGTVAKLESGSRPLRLNEVVALAAVFGEPVQSLWGRAEGTDGAAPGDLHRKLEVARHDVAQWTESVQQVRASLEDTQRRLEELRAAELALQRQVWQAESHLAQAELTLMLAVEAVEVDRDPSVTWRSAARRAAAEDPTGETASPS